MGLFNKLIKAVKGETIFLPGLGNRSRPKSATIELSDICSSVLDCNATHVARGNILHVQEKDGQISEIKRNSGYANLFKNPNPLMTKKDFIYSMAWQLQTLNTVFAWVKWDRHMNPVEIWPLVYLNFELREKKSGGYAVMFTDYEGQRQIVDADNLVIMRRKFDGAGFTARGNNELESVLEVSVAVDDALRQAAEISNKISGIMKQKKAMLKAEDTTSTDDAAKRIKYAAEHGGILSLDAMEDYIPLNPSTWTGSAAQTQQIRDRIHTYWRTPVEVVNNTAVEQTMQNYLDSVVEPIWEIMGEAFSKALFSADELNRGEKIIITTGAATGASWQTKINIVNNTKELGLLTINEYRELMGYSPIEDGDERMVSLNYINSKDQSKYQTGGQDGQEQTGQDNE